jgi:exodeoxyribonuclease V alpha subunit
VIEDAFDARRALQAPALLRAFNDAGVLAAADVHVAVRLTGLAGLADPEVTLAAALAVRAPRLGHVYVDLATVHATATVEAEEPVDLSELPWPEPAGWARALAESGLAGVGEDDPAADRPLRLAGTRLYLDRYWREERRLAADLRGFAAAAPADVDEAVLRDGIARLFPGATADSRPAASPPSGGAPAGAPRRDDTAEAAPPPGNAPRRDDTAEAAPPPGDAPRLFDTEDIAPAGSDLPRSFDRGAGAPAVVDPSPGAVRDDAGAGQARAAAAAVRHRFAVVAGGPGTGKTTTVARIVALLAEQAAARGDAAPLIALAARTGKAAARLTEAVHDAARDLDLAAPVRDQLLALEARTLHRLLGPRHGSDSRFRHDRGNRLPHDVVIVDETSMVSLSLMARLVDALRPDARLVLVGDPGQLTSIEAGAVLGDIVAPAVEGRGGGALGEAIVVLDHVFRHGDAIADLAAAVRAGDADGALALLERGAPGVTWIAADAADAEALEPVRAGAVRAGRAGLAAARAGDARRALGELAGFRLLCAHRRGPYGAATWRHHVERWLAAELPDFAAAGEWYAGRPLLITENDYGLGLFNGDTGVVVASPGDRVMAAFERRGEIVEFIPGRLGAVETVYAMTVHKSQGSEFHTAAVLLPPAASPILTRELLYTAITRARQCVILVATEAMIRAAIGRPAARASGLRERLWG